MRRRRTREGAIYAEALLVLPVIGLVGSLTAYVHRGFDHAIDAAVAVRGTAWTEARGACAEDTPEHEDVERQDRDLFGGAERAAGAVVAARTRLFSEQPLLGARTSALAFEIASGRWSLEGTVERSGAIGGEATYGHQLALACDERHSEVNLGAWIAAAAGAP
jgi:hypothetical protein